MNSMKFYIGERVICSENGVVGDDEFAMIGLDLAHGKDMTGGLLNPYGEYVIKFAENHGISIDAAYQHPTCKARLEYFNQTGR